MPFQFTSIPINDDNKIRIDPYDHPATKKRSFGWMYLSPRQPCAFKFFETKLFKIEIGPDFVDVSRRMAETTEYLEVTVIVRRFTGKKKRIDENNWVEKNFENLSDEVREKNIEGYQTRRINLSRRDDYRYAALNVLVHLQCRSLLQNIPSFLYKIAKNKKGFCYLDCIGGSLRVYKKTLSDHINYFKKLFSGKKKQSYQLDNVNLMDMIQLIYHLPPYETAILDGITFGSFYRLSEAFGCLKMAEICQSYIEELQSFAPCSASFIAFEGGVFHESKMYTEMKLTNVDEMREKLRQENVFREYYNTPPCLRIALAPLPPKKKKQQLHTR